MVAPVEHKLLISAVLSLPTLLVTMEHVSLAFYNLSIMGL
jgi:hypothetical protein